MRANVVCRKVLLLAMLLGPSLAQAQTARGVVVGMADAPIPGVVVQLRDSGSHVVGRALSNERGEFRLTAARPGTYRIHTLRIGYRPVVTEAFGLAAGAEVSRRLVLSGIPISLDTIRVADRNICRSFSDSGAATFAVWEQIRTALTAAQLSANGRVILATTVAYERTLDPGRRRVRQQSSRLETGYVRQPWLTLPIDSLRRVGYVITGRDNSITYYGPGIDMLLSDVFVEDHCFRLAAERARVGIEFEPVPVRRRIPEIRGTLWIDRASSELRRLEFQYVNVALQTNVDAGGAMDFARLANGMWAITGWNIQMPVVEQQMRSQALGGFGSRVAELHVAGGDLALARRGKDTLWSRPPLVMAGVVTDSASRSPVAGARITLAGTSLDGVTDARGRFTIAGVLPGAYTLEVRTPSLDSANAVHRSPVTFIDASKDLEVTVPSGRQLQAAFCGKSRMDAPGIVFGTVTLRGDTAPPTGARVIARWSDLAIHGATIDRSQRWLETKPDAHGVFRLCGVPVATELALSAESDAGSAEPIPLRISPEERLVRAELTLDASASRAAVFSGLVLADSTQQPIVGAQVWLPNAERTVVTDARGAFRISELAPGTHRVVVRRIGYGTLDTSLVLTARQTLDRRVFLSRAVSLDSVVVTATAFDRGLRQFEENRKVGLGHFFTRDQLAKMEDRTTSSILSNIPGLVVVSGKGTHAWIRSSRSPGAGALGVPESMDAAMGARPAACYSQVYLDGVMVFSGQRDGSGTFPPLFDVNSIPPDRIEAIEFYSSPAQTPAKYSGLASVCGVLVIYTRR